jgi:hypothetical protein
MVFKDEPQVAGVALIGDDKSGRRAFLRASITARQLTLLREGQRISCLLATSLRE